MAIVIHDTVEMQKTVESLRLAGRRLGVVPTMGSLHKGHLSLIQIAKERSDMVITTVFVNPTQFGPAEDFERYPRDLARDTSLATAAGTDYIFAPEAGQMYPTGYATIVDVDRLTSGLEGKSRPGHFRGVTTVVAKLFNLTKPHVAVFGQKDAQQAAVIQQMVKDLNFDIEIIVAPIVREQDGLALSSRNSYLTSDERGQATVLYEALQLANRLLRNGEKSPASIVEKMTELITSSSSGIIDYISIADRHTLQEENEIGTGRDLLISLAVRFGSTRLIDNIVVTI